MKMASSNEKCGANRAIELFLPLRSMNLQYGSILDSVERKKMVDHIDFHGFGLTPQEGKVYEIPISVSLLSPIESDAILIPKLFSIGRKSLKFSNNQ